MSRGDFEAAKNDREQREQYHKVSYDWLHHRKAGLGKSTLPVQGHDPSADLGTASVATLGGSGTVNRI
jgi:hypothetical protein